MSCVIRAVLTAVEQCDRRSSHAVVSALKNLEKLTTSDTVRLKAAGALWILEKKEPQQNNAESATQTHGLLFCSCNITTTTMSITKFISFSGSLLW